MFQLNLKLQPADSVRPDVHFAAELEESQLIEQYNVHLSDIIRELGIVSPQQ